MKTKVGFFLAIFIGTISFVSPATASVITFEDLYVAPDYWDQSLAGLGMQRIPNGYAGFQWSYDAAVINKQSESGAPGTAYEWGTIGTMSMFTAYGANISFVGGTFDFNGAYLTAHSDVPYDLVVQGYRNGALVYSKTITITPWASPSTVLPYFYTFNFQQVDSVAFITGGYRWVVIDNITINESFTAETSPLSNLARVIDDLVALGKVKRGIGNSLTLKLAAAASALKQGDRQTALSNLDAFIGEIQTHIKDYEDTGGRSDGSFPPTEGAALIQGAQDIAATI